MNASSRTCMDNQATEMGVIRGISVLLMIMISLIQYLVHETYTRSTQPTMLQTVPSINEAIASKMTTPYKILLLVNRQILRHTSRSTYDRVSIPAYLPVS